jgi:hypothetical protein
MSMLQLIFPLTCPSSFEKSMQLVTELSFSESRKPMNLNCPEGQPKTSISESKGDSAKLLSLLALAGGAIAMPQTTNADIVFVDLSANPAHVGPLTGSSYIINTLPGNAQLGFHTAHIGNNSTTSIRLVLGRQDAGYVRIKTAASYFLMLNKDQVWNPGIGKTTSLGFGGRNSYDRVGATPGSYNDKYLLFEFRDSTQPGSPMRYGWVELSLANTPGDDAHPDIAIEGYAWDTTGGTIATGQVPEPSAAALLALGALTLGAKGLRSWRKNRPTKP